MALSDIMIPTPVLISSLISLFAFAGAGVIFYAVKKKINQNIKETSEYKRVMENLKKQKTKTVAVKAEKKIKVDDIPDSKITPYSIIKSKSRFSLDRWKEYFKDKYFAGSIVLINMELTNGFHRTFTIIEKEEGFKFKGKKYLFDDESKYYNIDAKLYQFDYHEALALPIKKVLPLDKMKKDGMPIERKVPVTKIKQTLESTEGIDIEYAINPSTLQRFMTAKIAEGVMKGTQLDAFMQKLQMFLLVTMIVTVVHLALFLYASGILQNIKIPTL